MIHRQTVHYNASVTTEPFTVYSAKTVSYIYTSKDIEPNLKSFSFLVCIDHAH
jgi:hypothetical protein